ncbi:MAG: hypothetical protein ACFFDR_14530, partial [Candidatus Thorarchaeota archaeon]
AIVSVAAGLGVGKILISRDLRKSAFISKNIIVTVLLVGLLISTASFSHLLKVEYTSATTADQSNLAGLGDYLRSYESSDGESFLSHSSIYSFASALLGIPVYTQQTDIFGEICSRHSDLGSQLYVLEYLNVSHIIDNHAYDLHLDKIFEFAHISYHDDFFTVYAVSNLTHSSLDADTLFIQDHLPVETCIETGVSSDLIWDQNITDISKWSPVYSALANVTDYSFVSSDTSYAHLSATGLSNHKIVVFYESYLEQPIQIQSDMNIYIKFRTQESSKLILTMIYQDGTRENALLSGTPYMTSEDWTYAVTPLNEEKSHVVGLLLGLTNKFHESVSEIAADISKVAFGVESEFFNDIQMILSMSGISYTTISSFHFNTSHERTIIYTDSQNNMKKISEISQLVQDGHNIIIVGNLTNSSIITDFCNISFSEVSLDIESIRIGSSTFPIPRVQAQYVNVSGQTSQGVYQSENQSIPFVIEILLTNESSMTYLNVGPLISSLQGSDIHQDSIRISSVLQYLFQNILDLQEKSEFERGFYLKNRGEIHLDGILRIQYSEDGAGLVDGIDGGILEFHGEISISSISFGYSLVKVNGFMIVHDSNSIVHQDLDFDEPFLIRITELEGSGFLAFNSLWSGVPYNITLNGERFVSQDAFQLRTVMISPSIILIAPVFLHGVGVNL